jgi:hypothetical protein
VHDLEEQVMELTRALQEAQQHVGKLQHEMDDELSHEWARQRQLAQDLQEREARLDQRQEEWRAVQNNEIKEVELTQAKQVDRLAQWEQQLQQKQVEFEQAMTRQQQEQELQDREVEERHQTWQGYHGTSWSAVLHKSINTKIDKNNNNKNNKNNKLSTHLMISY